MRRIQLVLGALAIVVTALAVFRVRQWPTI